SMKELFMLKNILFLFFTACLAFTSFSCSHTPPVADLPATANPTDELQKLGTDMQTAAVAQVDVLAPDNYSKAREYLDDAVKARDKGKDNSKVLKNIAISRAYLNEANGRASQVEGAIPEVAKARHDAVAAGAQTTQREEMNNADKELIDMTEDLER